MERVLSRDALNKAGQRVSVSGWVHRVRDFGGLCFIVLRDRLGTIQLVSTEAFSLPVESVITARGTVQVNPKAPGGAEVALEDFTVLARAESDLPIAVNQDPAGLSWKPYSITV